MSLLMDALRRAEAERRLHERGSAETDPRSGETSATVPGADEPTVVAAEDTEAAADPSGDATVGAGDDSLALDLSELTLAPLELTYPGSIATDATATSVGIGAERVEQTSTLPSNRARSSDMRAYFDQSQSVEYRRSAALAADMTLEDVAAHTVVGAQTVFAAGERPRRRSLAVAGVLVAVVLLLGVGVAAVFYAAQTRTPQVMPSPAVAEGVERPLPRSLPVVPLTPAPAVAEQAPKVDIAPAASAAATPGSGELAASVAPPVPPETSATVAPDTESATAMPATAAGTPAPASSAVAAASPAAPAVAVAPVPEPEVAAPAPPAPLPAPSAVAAPAAAVTDVNAGELRIARNPRPAAVDPGIARAYAAFKARDLVQAETLYRAALVAQPTSRDALLGLAGVAIERGDRDGAYRYYRQLLDLHPDDPIASTALFTLTGADGDAARLKLLVDTHPRLALLRFALGNWYARAGRWADAQQTYFEAVRLEADNADYAYNLAVALDRIGQRDAALDYYQKSLELADRGGTSFNPAAVLARIGTLTGAASR